MEIKIIEEGELSVLLGEKELDILDYGEEYVRAECSIEDLVNKQIMDIPQKLILETHDLEKFQIYPFTELEITKDNDKISLEFICREPNKYWNDKWKLATY